MKTLKECLIEEMEKVGLPCNPPTLVIRPYSKTLYGGFYPKTNTIRLFIYKDKSHKIKYSYDEIMKTLIHERIHVEQYNDPSFVRVKGIMHDAKFIEMENHYLSVYEEVKDKEVCYAESVEDNK